MLYYRHLEQQKERNRSIEKFQSIIKCLLCDQLLTESDQGSGSASSGIRSSISKTSSSSTHTSSSSIQLIQ